MNGDTRCARSTTAPDVLDHGHVVAPRSGSYPSSCSGAVDANYTITLRRRLGAGHAGHPVGHGLVGARQLRRPRAGHHARRYSGFVDGDTAPLARPRRRRARPRPPRPAPSGSYPTSCSGAVDPNYTISYIDGSVQVGPAPLVVTASSASITYGGAPPVITASYSGFVNGDDATSLTTAPTCSTSVTSVSPVGTYASSCSGAVDPNYSFNYVDGSVQVGPASITVTASSGSMVYGIGRAGSQPVVLGLQNGDDGRRSDHAPTCSTTATSASPVGSYPTSCSGAVDSNYTISYVGGSIVVGPPPPVDLGLVHLGDLRRQRARPSRRRTRAS